LIEQGGYFMPKYSLQGVINHHNGTEALHPMFLFPPNIGDFCRAEVRLAFACCEAIEKSGMVLTVELLKETVKLNMKEEYAVYMQVPAYKLAPIQLPQPTEPKQTDNLGVTVENGKVIVSSLDIARVFEKQHYNVIRDIESLDCSEEFNAFNFECVKYNDQKGEKRPAYKLTRDGFTFLVMGYTGKKAACFKEAYIKRFNDMEKILTNPALPASAPPAKKEKLYTPEEAAEELMLRGYRKFYALMIQRGFFAKVSNKMYCPKPEYIRQGLFEIFRGHNYKRPLVTQKGIEYLNRELQTT